jgi:hypothetical protein
MVEVVLMVALHDLQDAPPSLLARLYIAPFPAHVYHGTAGDCSLDIH